MKSLSKVKDPYAALRYPEFRRFISAQFIFTIAVLIQEFTIAFYLYDITENPLSLGLIGLFEAIPYISLALFGGYLADKFDKRNIARIAFVVVMAVSVLLLLCTSKEAENVTDIAYHERMIYFCVFLFGIARGFFSPAMNSLKPYLVKPEHYANSATWSSQVWQSGVIIGPSCAGFSYAYLGLHGTLYLVIVLLVFPMIFISLISPKPLPPKTGDKMFANIKEGLHFVYNNKILWYSILLDMLTVLFAGVIAILPVFAKDILHVGEIELGFLRAAPGIGAVLTIFMTAYISVTRRAWKNMLLATFGFGVSTLIFAFSQNLYLSFFALMLTGIFDSISVVIRSTIMQMFPPENMRGRINSVNGIFVSTSNELGAFESGATASLFGTVPSVLAGVGLTFAIVTYISFKTKKLLGIDLDDIKEVGKLEAEKKEVKSLDF